MTPPVNRAARSGAPGASAPRRPTIADVARRAGVSQAAVSFAVNGRPGVGEDTRARILRAADELGWRPSARARALTQARAQAIGVVLARDAGQLERDAFFVRFLSGIERTLAPRDQALLLHVVPPEHGVDVAAYERLARSGRVDGFILTDVEWDDRRVAILEALRVPTVVAGRAPATWPFPGIETEHGRGMQAAVRHLTALGHERIAFFGASPALDYVHVRLGHWRTALAYAGREQGPVIHTEPGEPVAAAAARVVASGATAVTCTSDPLAVAVLASARAAGRRVPEDLSVIGFDDSALAVLASPPLTSVHVDYAEFGAETAAALLALIDGRAVAPPRLSEPALAVRASTAAPG